MRLSVGMTVVVSTVSLVGPGLGLVRPQGTRESGANPQVVTSATFHGLGDLPGGAFFSEANAVSADGSVVVGTSRSASGFEAFRWTRAQGMVGMGFLPEGVVASAASDVSADGSVIVGTAGVPGSGGPWSPSSTMSFRWTADSGFVALGRLSPSYWPFQVRAFSVSADGSVIVGEQCSNGAFGPAFCQAFRWTPDEGMVRLGDPLLDSTAAAVSADGSIVIGSVETGNSPCDCIGSGGCGAMHDGFRWTRSGGMTTLGLPPAGCFGNIVSAVSADGRTVVGTQPDEHLAFLWTAGTGLVFLDDLERGPTIWANAVSADGSVVVGTRNSWSARGSEAFLWDADHGMRSLRSLLVDEHGLDLTGWTLMSANGVSDDGLTIVGAGVDPDGSTEGWIATLPPKDTDGDGVPDVADACQDSNTEETLSIGTCETGLPNVVDTEGCTLADSLARVCPFATGTNVGREAASNAHGGFVACVAHLANDWRSAGRIDRGQQGRVIACASTSDAPNLPSARPIP